MLSIARIENRDRVTVSNANDTAGEGLTTDRRVYGLRRRGLALRLSGTADAEDSRKSNQPNKSRRVFRGG